MGGGGLQVMDRGTHEILIRRCTAFNIFFTQTMISKKRISP